MTVADRSPAEWLELWRSMTDDELLDERCRLFDAADVAERGSELHTFVKWALAKIAALRCYREARASVRLTVMYARPDLDPEAFTEAVIAINRGRRQLGLEADAAEIFGAALEVAERRITGTDG